MVRQITLEVESEKSLGPKRWVPAPGRPRPFVPSLPPGGMPILKPVARGLHCSIYMAHPCRSVSASF